VRAAAYEAPLTDDDVPFLGPAALELAASDPDLRRTHAGIVWGGRDQPAARVPLRSANADTFTIVDATTGAVLGQIDRSRAYGTVHAGAVYLHLGDSYLVRELDLTSMHAIVEPFTGDWYTQTKKETETAIVTVARAEDRLGLTLHFGELEVTEHVVAYDRRTVSSQERIDLVPLELPPTSFSTEAVWFCPEPGQLAGLDEMPRLLGTLHAAEHALIALLPLWAMCDRWDIGGLSTNIHPQTLRPTVFVYDGHPGGVGITERGFDEFEGWVEDTAELLRACPCSSGCPSCVQSPKCGNLNEMLDKSGASTFLGRLVDFGGLRSSYRRHRHSEGGER